MIDTEQKSTAFKDAAVIFALGILAMVAILWVASIWP